LFQDGDVGVGVFSENEKPGRFSQKDFQAYRRGPW
jgi:hypothetical protein